VFALRKEIPAWQAVICAVACVALFFGAWWYVTKGEIVEERIYPPYILPSPSETFAKLPALWTKARLAENTYISLRRVVLGFSLAVLVGVPVGVLCGCFSRISAFFTPITAFGRNVPMAALIPLTFALFGSTTEKQKYMFIFLSCVAFVVSDTAGAIRDVGSQYVDTAFTLGANLRQVILKVVVPLALPNIFNSLRVLFGLAFGYIMLAELVKTSDKEGGLGYIINLSQVRGSDRAYSNLILLLIPIVALVIDRLLYLIQTQLFPYRYGGHGYLLRCVQFALRGWENLKRLFFTTAPADAFPAPRSKATMTK
jgi:ABC-type nitrate/sulfonate/bicarbonate transport system permease component